MPGNVAQHCANVAPDVMDHVVPSIAIIVSGLLDAHLMVAKNGDRTVCSIVRQHFRVDILVGVGELSQLFLQCHGGVVRSENLGGETFHQLRQVLVQWRRLNRANGVSKTRCKHVNTRSIKMRSCFRLWLEDTRKIFASSPKVLGIPHYQRIFSTLVM